MASRTHAYASFTRPSTSASTALLFMYIATIVSSEISRERIPRRFSGGRKSIVNELLGPIVVRSPIFLSSVMLT